MIIGIDFGSCYSSIAIMKGSIPVASYISRDYDSGVGIPSLFMYSDEKKKELYGLQCESANPNENDNVIKYMKTKVREDPTNITKSYPSGSKSYTLKEVIEKYIDYLITTAKKSAIDSGEFSNDTIEAITITTPIGISTGQMMATDYNEFLKEMVEKLTGLEKNVNILSEPVAAAISYLYTKDINKEYKDSQTILVFDLGGGTLDVTIVKYNPQQEMNKKYEILSKEGDLQLGGNNWDNALGNLLLEKAGIDQDDFEPARKVTFWNDVTRLKISLSDRDEDSIPITVNDKNKSSISCTRQEFENATEKLLNRAMDVIKRSISSIDGGIQSIDKIVMVGGSSNMPQIKRRIAEEFSSFDENNILLYDPSRAIARGAAIFAKFNSKRGGVQAAQIVSDVSTNTYGFESHRNGDREHTMIYNLIIKGMKFDETYRIHKRSKDVNDGDSFIAFDDSQTCVTFRIYESQWVGNNATRIQSGSETKDDKNWMELGNGETMNGMEITVQIPPEFLGKACSYVLYVEFDLDQNGILEVTVKDINDQRVGFATNRNI